MSEHFEGQVELIDQRLQDNKQGTSLTVIFKMPTTKSQGDRDIHKELIDFMDEPVKVKLQVESNKRFGVVIEGDYWMKTKKLKKSTWLIMEITIQYDKPMRKKLVDLEYNQLLFEMDKVQKSLELMTEEEESE